jgi:YfiH family protein
MRIEEIKFLELEGWRDNGIIIHGFGTRGKACQNASKLDGWGQPIRVGDEVFPLILVHQVHGDGVVVFGGEAVKPENVRLPRGDALVTRVPGYALGVLTADCLPILLFDPVRMVVGIVHTGWRGTARAICQKTLKKMAETFDIISENVLAAMGPCIGPCCYEVDGPVKEAFEGNGLPWDLISSPRGRGRWSLDLHQANIFLLERSGVRKENIHRLELCTSCNNDFFNSYRAEGGNVGRQLNFIALRKRNVALGQ